MSFSAGTGYVDLTVGSTAALKTGVAAAGEEAGIAGGTKLKSGLFNTVKGLAGPIIGIMALDKLFEFVKGGAQDWGVLQAAVRQTNAVLTSTGGAANISSDGITTLTESLSKKTAMDQAAIRSGENMLLTFTNVKNGVGKGNDIFNQATGTILDMSKALGQDTKNSAIQLGKALNDPIKGVTALQRVGVTFTSTQKDQIKSMVAANNTMGAQKIILAELNKEFGGSAAASATGGAKLALTMKDLAMNLYGLIAPLKTIGITFSTWLVTPIADGVAKLIPIQQKMVASFKSSFNEAKTAEQTLGSWDWHDAAGPIQQLAEFLGVWVGEAKDLLGLARQYFAAFVAGLNGSDVTGFNRGLGTMGVLLVNLGQFFHDTYMKMLPFIERWGPLAGQTAAISGAFLILATVLPTIVSWVSKLSVVVGLLGKAMGLLAKNPLLVALSLLVGAFYALYQVSPKFREFISQMIDQFGKLADQVLPQIENAFNQLVTALTPVLEQLGPAIKALFDALMPIVSALLSGLAVALSAVMPYIVSFIGILGEGIKTVIGFFKGGQAASAGGGFIGWIINAWNTVKSIFDAAVGWVGGAVKAIGDWLSYMFSPLEPLIPKFELFFSQLAQGFQTMWAAISPVLSAVFNYLGPILGSVFTGIWAIIQPILSMIGSLFGTVFGAIFNIVSAVFGAISSVIRGVMEIIAGIIGLFLDIITGNWNGVWNDLASIVKGVVDIVFGIVNGFVEILRAIFTAGLSIVTTVIQGAWNVIVGVFVAAFGFLNSVIGGGIEGVVGWFRSIGSKVSNAIGDLGQLLVRAGQSIIDGLLAGIKAAWKGITDFVGGIAQWISDHKGPISYDKTLLTPHGKAIMGSLLEGLKSESGTIQDWLSSFTDNLSASATIGVTSSVKGAGIGGASAAGSNGTTYNVYANDDPHSTAMAIDRIQTNAARTA